MTQPTWQDYQDELYRPARNSRARAWLTASAVIALLCGGVFLAFPVISGLLTPSDTTGTVIRNELVSVQQQMEFARLSGDGFFTEPFPDNPHRTDSGVVIAICMGEGNSSYVATAYATDGEYWNATSTLPGSVKGPESTAVCLNKARSNPAPPSP